MSAERIAISGGGARSLYSCCAIAAMLAAMAGAGRAQAQADDTVARAEALFREGRAAMRRNSYVEACDKFRESDSLDPSPGTRLNWALCDGKMGHLVQALQRTRWVLDRLDADDPRRPIASQLAADLEKRLPRLTVRLAPGWDLDAKIYLDGERLPMDGTEQTRVVDPGSHVILVERRPHETTSLVVNLEEGEDAVRSLSATQQRRDEGASQPSPRLRSTSAVRPVGDVIGISALVNFGATAVFWGLALGQRGVVEAHCPDKQCDREGFDAGQRARGFVNLGTLTLGVGVAGAAGTAILLWPRNATTSVALGILPGGVGLAVGSSL